MRETVRWNKASEISWEDFPELEKMNGVKINVFELVKNSGGGFSLATRRRGKGDSEKEVDLLVFENHASLIKDFDKYVKEFRRDRRQNIKQYCKNCLQGFENLAPHSEHCHTITGMKFKKRGEKLKFANLHKSHPLPYVAFADTEALLVPPPVGESDKTENYHKMIAFGYVIVEGGVEVVKSQCRVSANAADDFISNLRRDWKGVKERKQTYPLTMTEADQEKFNATLNCELCHQPFKSGRDKHRHHDHLVQGRNYLGAYCNRCNFACSDRRNTLTVFLHNMSYDLGLVLKEMRDAKAEITIHPKTNLKFLSVKIGDLKFVDSLQVMNGSLESLAKQFVDGGNAPRFTHQMVPHLDKKTRECILKGKGKFPYEYLSSADKLRDEQLPPIEKFYSKLKGCGVTPEEYEECQEMWILGKCKTLQDYLLLYLAVDVGFLTDTFLKWRETLHKLFGLDVAQYVSLPSFSFDAMLKTTKVELDYPQERESFELIQRNIRGGFCGVISQKAEARNNDLGNLVEGDESSYILYLDFNSLYPHVMREPLATGDFRLLNEVEKENFLKHLLHNGSVDGEKGYLLLVDTKPVTDPKTLELLNEYPPYFAILQLRRMICPYTLVTF